MTPSIPEQAVPAPAGWQPPKGWKLVPVDPTPEMVDAGCRSANSWNSSLVKNYAAMLAAAPAPAKPKEG